MSQDFIAGKRYPRGMRRSGSADGRGGKTFRSYFDLSKALHSSSVDEYQKIVAEIKKMGNSFC